MRGLRGVGACPPNLHEARTTPGQALSSPRTPASPASTQGHAGLTEDRAQAAGAPTKLCPTSRMDCPGQRCSPFRASVSLSVKQSDTSKPVSIVYIADMEVLQQEVLNKHKATEGWDVRESQWCAPRPRHMVGESYLASLPSSLAPRLTDLVPWFGRTRFCLISQPNSIAGPETELTFRAVWTGLPAEGAGTLGCADNSRWT